MSVDNPESLEKAIHRLREAQMFHNNEEYNHDKEMQALEAVDDALGHIDDYVDDEKARRIINDLE